MKLNSYHLKWIAMTSMLIDHIGYVFLQGTSYYIWFRAIGRIAFPLYCFLLVEGFFHTHNLKNYCIRIAIWAVVTEIPFDLMASGTPFAPNYQNVLFTLLLGLFAMISCNLSARFVLVPCCIFGGYLLHSDYGAFGVLLILVFYLYRPQILSLFAFYNGKKGNSKLPSWFYYAFYPVHMLVLWTSSYLFFPN
jgi:hypothetical protein